MRRNKRLVWPFLLLALQSVSSALAEPSITWRAPATCPQQNEVLARIEERVRGMGRATESLFVRAQVEGDVNYFRLRFSLRRGTSEAERELVAASCDELVDALTWLVAIGAPRLPKGAAEAAPEAAPLPVAAEPAAAAATAVDTADGGAKALSAPPAAASTPAPPAASSRESSREEAAPTPRAPSNTPLEPVDDEGPTQPVARGARWLGPRWLRAEVGAGIWSGGLPKPQALLQGGFGIGFGAAYLALRFAHLFERSAAFAEGRSVGIRGNALTALGCGMFRLADERLRLGPCLHVVGMYTVAVAHGITSPKRGTYAWLLGGVSAQAALRLYAPVELIAEAGLSLPWGPRPGFAVAEHGEVARSSTLSEQGSLAIGAHW